MPTGSGGLRFRLLGFPVRVDPLFLVVMGVLGYVDGEGLGPPLVWVLVAGVSVLVHELGHALAARGFGRHAEIELYGFGGVTSHSGGPLSRGQDAWVSLAGPLAGIALGAGVLSFHLAGTTPDDGLGEYAVRAALLANLGWSLLNLLPIVPLDGGHLLTAALPGELQRRQRIAAAVSALVAVAAAAVALGFGLLIAAALAGWFAFGNVVALRRPKPAAHVGQPTGDLERAALALVDAGEAEKARHLLATVPGSAAVDPAVVALVLAATGDTDAGLAIARRAAAEAPADPLRADLLARVERLHGDRLRGA